MKTHTGYLPTRKVEEGRRPQAEKDIVTTLDEGNSYSVKGSVTPVNAAPQITGQALLSTAENQPIALLLTHLIVADPDDAYPEGFTLSVLAGDNYAVSGNQITPVGDFNGTLSVPVFVNDGEANSNFFNVQITVNPVNDPPVITGQIPVTVSEDEAVMISLQHVTVSDVDNTYPDGFTLVVQPGEQYTYSASVVTPAPDFAGTLKVFVKVNDGQLNSEAFPFQITITPVNDDPVITGQKTLTTAEDVPRTIELTDLVVEDPDNTYPTGFTLLVSAGDHYTLSGNTVVPAPDYSGPLTIPVQVNDGTLNSNIFALAMDVTPVNDAPVITGQMAVAATEDTPVTILLSQLTVLDVDNNYPAGFSLTVLPGTSYSALGSTVTPVMDFTGTLNVNLAVSDGTSNSAPFVFQIQVGDANDAPLITGQATATTDEEKPVTLKLSHLIVSDPDSQYPSNFSLLISSGNNYEVAGQTITPALNFAGVLTIPLRVNDGVNNSPTFNFQLQVNQINDPPVFAAIPNQQATENSPARSITIQEISKGPFEETQQLTFVATSSNTAVIDNPTIKYNGTSSKAVLTYAVKPNQSGVVTINIVAIDNGSNTPPHQNTFSSAFQIQVLEVNDAPTIDAISNMTILEDAEQQNVALTGISAGPGESQTVSIEVSSNEPSFFEQLDVVYNSPEATGLLRFKSKRDVSGTAKVTVTVMDNGSGVSPNVNRVTKTFNVEVQPVNDPPVFTSTPVTVAVVDEMYEYEIRVSDPDDDPIDITAESKPFWARLSSQGNGRSRLRGTPSTAGLGNAGVRLEAKDDDTTVEQVFTIYVNARPSVISLTAITEEDVPLPLPTSFFVKGYRDANENALAGIQVTELPEGGTLGFSGGAIGVGDTLTTESLSTLVYSPNEDFFGKDSFAWKASDGYHLSLTSATVEITVLSINDPPEIIFDSDTLLYEVNGEPAFLSPSIELHDADDDSLMSAEVGFHVRNYVPQMDILEYDNTAGIKGTFDFTSGRLRLTGKATVEDYTEVIRSIQYLHQNTLDPVLVPKVVYYSLNDGESENSPTDKTIILQYTFTEFKIPSGFTPNGDRANDTWIIERPGGGLEEMNDAVISVYNRQGVLVFRTKGFGTPWDGTMNGEMLPADSYFFTIDLKLRNNKTYKGVVTILR